MVESFISEEPGTSISYPQGGGSRSLWNMCVYHAMQHYIPEDSDAHTHQHEHLKSLTQICSNSKHKN
jgi:hypothetical protein